jgi:hypothetical protein
MSEFIDFLDDTLRDCWRSVFGWRRFLVPDWWRDVVIRRLRKRFGAE